MGVGVGVSVGVFDGGGVWVGGLAGGAGAARWVGGRRVRNTDFVDPAVEVLGKAAVAPEEHVAHLGLDQAGLGVGIVQDAIDVDRQHGAVIGAGQVMPVLDGQP